MAVDYISRWTYTLVHPRVANISSNPALSDITVKTFNVMEEQTAITKGPV